MSSGVSLAVVLTMIVAAIVLAVREYKQTRLQRLRARKLQSSPMFLEMTPLLRLMRRLPVERLEIGREGVRVRFVNQRGTECAFLVAAHGYPELTRERRDALRLLMEEFIPKLRENELYALRHKRLRLANGDWDGYDQYTIRNEYKTRLSRAPYYDGTLQGQV